MLPGFLIYLTELRMFDNILTDEDLGKVVRAIAAYTETGREPDKLPPVGMACFRVFREKVDREQRRYQAKVDNGSKGGRPPKKPNETEKNLKKPNETENDLGFSQETENNKTETETETESETESETVTDLLFFTRPPTLDEVRRYAQETKTTINPDKFFFYYQARHWQLKPGMPMDDWKAAFAVWVVNEQEKGKKTVTAQQFDQRQYDPGFYDKFNIV